MMDFDAFISYSSKDKPVADATCAALEAAGVRCWIAPRDIVPGREYGAAIIEAIEHCRVMVLVFSSNANESRQIHREVERAVSKGVAVVPLRIEDTAPTKSMEYFIGTIHWLDALTPPLETHLQRLADTVKALVQAQSKRSPGEQISPAIGRPSSEALASPPGVARRDVLPTGQSEAAHKPQSRKTLVIALSAVAAICILGLVGFLIASQWRSGPTFCEGEQSSRSIVGTNATAVSFTNYRGSPVRIYWLDYNGARKLYATIGPGLSHVQSTYVSHPWVVTDLSDRCIGIYEPETQRRDYAIR